MIFMRMRNVCVCQLEKSKEKLLRPALFMHPLVTDRTVIPTEE